MAWVSRIVSRYFFQITLMMTYLFLYVPVVVLILFSFNDNEFTYTWSSFTMRWYHDLFSSTEIWDAFKNSLMVAVSSVMLSISMGVLLVFYSSHDVLGKLIGFFYGNLVVSEIVLAVGMLSFFSFFSIPLGITTLIAGHTLIGLGYVIPIIYTQFQELDNRYTEASLDLGATYAQTLRRIILPMLSPAVIAAGLLVFIISFDDFVFTFFCAGASTQTLPLYIFSMLRTGASPLVSALSTMLLITSSVVVLVFSFLQVKKVGIPK